MARARQTGAVKIEQLRRLDAGSLARVDYALALAATEISIDVLQAALDELAAATDPRARTVLLNRFSACTDGHEADSGCDLRVALVRTLRYLARRDDAPGVLTYEFLPPFVEPHRGDVASRLRAAALVTLNEVDVLLTSYHATRMLAERYTSPMSGEPAVTAAQVLAAQGQTLPLYGYALRQCGEPGTFGVSEVVGECLRNLTPLPASMLPALVEHYRASDDEIVLLGLFDLLLAHETRMRYDDMILDFLRTTRLYNIYHYLVSAIVASRRDELVARLATMAPEESDRVKGAILREALELA